jgi:hypothetical protein
MQAENASVFVTPAKGLSLPSTYALSLSFGKY